MVAATTHQEGPREGPSWLPDFLQGSYFVPCQAHVAAHKTERNFFCTQCGGDSICSTCILKQHQGHITLQIRRSSYHDAVRIADVKELLDLSQIQVYVINSAKIVFLNARPQKVVVKGAPFFCEVCSRALVDPTRFCSVGCKLAAIPGDSDEQLTLQPKLQPPAAPQGGAGFLAATEESAESGGTPSAWRAQAHRKFKEHQQQQQHPGQLAQRLPPLIMDDGSDHDDDGDSHHGVRQTKRRSGGAKHLHAEYQWDIPPLVSVPTSPAARAPRATPPHSATTNCTWPMSSSKRRKGTPHRAPFW